MQHILRMKHRTYLSSPLEHQRQLCEAPRLRSWLTFRIHRFELGLRARELDLARKSIAKLRELSELFAARAERARFLDGRGDPRQLFLLAQDDLLRLSVQ